MEGKGQDGAATPPMEQQIGDLQRQELLATALREDNTPATAICIYCGEDAEKNVNGRLDTFFIKHCRVYRVLQGHQQGGTHVCHTIKITCTFLHAPAHTCMRATKDTIEHIKDRL